MNYNQFLSKIFFKVSEGIFYSFLVSVLLFYSGILSRLLNSPLSIYLYFISFALQLGTVFYLSARVHKMRKVKLDWSYTFYCFLSGTTLSVIFAVYDSASILVTFCVAATLFSVLAFAGDKIKKDLTAWGPVLFMGLIGLIISGILNLFMQNAIADFAISSVGILVFMGLIIYDSNLLKLQYANLKENNNLENIETDRIVILSALSMYLDFINLFLYLLRFLGSKK